MGYYYTDEELDKLIDLWNSGVNTTEISKILNRSERSICVKIDKLRDKLGSEIVHIRHPKFIRGTVLSVAEQYDGNTARLTKLVKTESGAVETVDCSFAKSLDAKTVSKIIELYTGGTGAPDIAEKLGVSVGCVRQCISTARDAGVDIEKRGGKTNADKNHRLVTELINSGKSAKEAASITGYSVARVREICRRGVVSGTINPLMYKGRANIPSSDIIKIIEMWNSGMSARSIGEKVGRSEGVISNIVHRARVNGMHVVTRVNRVVDKDPLILESLQKTHNVSATARELGLPQSSLHRYLRLNNWIVCGVKIDKTTMHHKIHELLSGDRDKVLDMWNSGTPVTHIAKELNVCVATVYNILREKHMSGVYVREGRKVCTT